MVVGTAAHSPDPVRRPRLLTSLMPALLLALTLLSAGLCWSGEALAEAPARLRVVIDDNYPPYIFRGPDGVLEGYLVDIWKLWESRTGVGVDLIATDWRRAQAMMEAGEADVIDTIFRTAARDAKYDFSHPYADIPVSIWSRKEIGGIVGTDTLRGFLVGVKAGDACADRLRAAGVTTLEPFDSYQKLVDAAASDWIKIFCLDDPPAGYLLYRSGQHRSFHRSFSLYSGEFHRAVHKGDDATLKLVENGFAAIPERVRRELLDKWMGPQVELDAVGRYAGYVLLVSLVVGGVATGWVLLLRRAVRRRTRELASERTRLRTLLDTLPDMVWLKDGDGAYLACNPGVERIFGAPESKIVGRTDHDFVPRKLADLFRRMDLEAIARRGPNTNLEEVSYADGSRTLTLEVIKTPMFDAAGALVGVLGIGRDVTERHQQEQRLRMAARVFESTAEAIMIADTANRAVAVNRAFSEITGHGEAEALGRDGFELIGADPATRVENAAQLAADGVWQGELTGRRCSGEPLFLWLTISAVRDDGGAVTHHVGVFSDITPIKASREALDFLAHHDQLTGLPNRGRFQEQLRAALAGAEQSGRQVAVLFVDLDGFKHINDSLGHPVGDTLLRVAAGVMRQSVSNRNTVSRLGGDEYVVLVEDAETPAEVAVIAGRLNEAFSKALPVDGRDLYVTASIGIALYPADGADADTLLKSADLAMYRAKDAGRNTFRFYDAEMGEQAARRLAITSALRGALERGEMAVAYQPIVRLDDGELTGVEALLRWLHPELGTVSPAEFIPVAEENGAIQEIGAWVLRQSCRQAAEWRRHGFIVPRVAVNLSVQQLEHGNLVPTVQALMAEFSLSPDDIELEITESMAMRESLWLSETLEELKRCRICLVIDDFGTGHSSLARLKQLPVQRLKIDRSFVRDMDTDADDEAIVRAIITLGHSLRLEVLAEGVERPEQAAYLAACGCDLAQGYHFGRPMPPGELLERWHRPPRPVTAPEEPSRSESMNSSS
ncbi:MAG: EAL domain-containing protein [Rhodospirillaceae bacterium]